MVEKSILNTIEKITGEKIERTEKLEPKTETPKKRGRPDLLKKYRDDVKAGKRQPIKPWSKKKAKKPEDPKKEVPKVEPKKEVPKVEPKKEELKPKKMKLKEKPFDRESDKIKKKLESKVTDEKTLERKVPKVEEKGEPKEFLQGFSFDWIIVGLGLVLVIILVVRFLGSKSIQTPVVSLPGTKKIDIGRGKIIEVPA